MYRIYSTGIETAAASAILIPILFLYHIFIFQHKKDGSLYTFFIISGCNMLFSGISQYSRDENRFIS